MEQNKRINLIYGIFFYTLCVIVSPHAIAAEKNNNETDVEAEEILVVGTRVMGRSAEDLPVPVDIITADELQNTGQVEVGRMLQQLVPSFNFSSSSISDGTDALRPATLRGLGPDQTLVLVNGKRRHQASLIHINTSVGRGTAGVDMNAIPAAAIKRIEVLRDGAAAQYGSDAIAGIINIILKDEDEAAELDMSYGQYSEGDGKTANLNLNKGFTLGENGFLNASLNYRDRGYTNRANPQGICLYGGGCYDSNGDPALDVDGNGFNEVAAANAEREINGRGRTGFRIGDAESTQIAAILNGRFSLPRGELYGFMTYSHRDNESGAFYRNPTFTNGVDSALLSDGLNPADPDGFLPIIQSYIDDFSISLGYELEFENESTLDLSYTYGLNTIDYTTKNSANYSFANFLQFDQGLSDEAVRANIPREAYAYGLELGLSTINLDFTSRYRAVDLAVGAEFRIDSYRLISGDEYSYFDYDTDLETGNPLYAQDAGGGIQGFNGVAPESSVNEERNVVSLYIDTEYQITNPWLINATLRYDHYDGFGSTTNYKVATNYEVNDHLTLRGGSSTGFRAPSMQQLYFNNVSTQIRASGAVTVGTYRNDSALVQSLGVPTLHEEQSKNYSLGLVITVTDNWNITADYYSIDIEDRIMLSNQLDANDDPNGSNGQFASELKASGVESAQFFLNGANTETEGIDIVSTYRGIACFDGLLDIAFAANYTNTKVTDIFTPSQGAVASLDPTTVISKQDISIIEDWQPQDRVSLSGLYRAGPLAASVTFNRYGEYTVLDSTEQTYSAAILTDFNIKYTFSGAWTVKLGGNNIFDVTPDETTNTSSRGGMFESTAGAKDLASPTVFRYSRRSAPFGFNGAFYYLGLSRTF